MASLCFILINFVMRFILILWCPDVCLDMPRCVIVMIFVICEFVRWMQLQWARMEYILFFFHSTLHLWRVAMPLVKGINITSDRLPFAASQRCPILMMSLHPLEMSIVIADHSSLTSILPVRDDGLSPPLMTWSSVVDGSSASSDRFAYPLWKFWQSFNSWRLPIVAQ